MENAIGVLEVESVWERKYSKKSFNEDEKSYFVLLHPSHSDVWFGVLEHFTKNEEMLRNDRSVVP